MESEIKQELIKRLRSGVYEQGAWHWKILSVDGKWNLFGVLLDIAYEYGQVEFDFESKRFRYCYDFFSYYYDPRSYHYYYDYCYDNYYYDNYYNNSRYYYYNPYYPLVWMNITPNEYEALFEQTKTFKEIADVVESFI